MPSLIRRCALRADALDERSTVVECVSFGVLAICNRNTERFGDRDETKYGSRANYSDAWNSHGIEGKSDLSCRFSDTRQSYERDAPSNTVLSCKNIEARPLNRHTSVCATRQTSPQIVNETLACVEN